MAKSKDANNNCVAVESLYINVKIAHLCKCTLFRVSNYMGLKKTM
jgi:hypothetical protein